MRTRNLAAIAPLALLAACGGADSGSGDAAPASPAAQTPEPAPAVPPAAAPAAAPVPGTTPAVASAAPAEFAVCRACHAVEAGRNGVGPTLFGIVGSTAGEVPGYAFSPALKASGIVWDRARLDTWLQGPMKMVPGTKMVITVPDAARRKAIIDYLETLK